MVNVSPDKVQVPSIGMPLTVATSVPLLANTTLSETPVVETDQEPTKLHVLGDAVPPHEDNKPTMTKTSAVLIGPPIMM